MTDQAEKKHSAFWGVMVIAGTVIGGGMFALPVDLAGAWFFWGAFILIIAWFSMLHSGLLLLEANLNYPVGSSFNTITKDLIGNTWNIISGITVAFVLYILTYAYISANGAIISETISMNLGYHANPRIVGICTAIFVASVLWISSLAASRITSLFLGLKIISFVIVFGSFFFQVDYSILRDATSTTAGTSYFPYIFMALPVCLASFGFHGNIPSLIICYGKRKDKLIKSVVFGSLLALVIYLFWLYCTMGNIPRESFKAIISSGGNVDSLVKSFLGTKQHGIIEFCLLVFSNLAVASSFFGVTLGVFDYLARDMGLDVAAVIQADDTQAPSASDMMKLIKAIRGQQVGAIFTEPQYPDKVAATLSRETGVATAKLDPAATGPASAPLDYYENTMRANLHTLESTLGTN